MAYCKFCGMESKTTGRCEWCGRDLPRLRRVAPPAVGTAQPKGEGSADAPFTFFIYESLQRQSPTEDTWDLATLSERKTSTGEVFLDFLLYVSVMVLMGSALVAWHLSNPLVLITIGAMFLSGVLLAAFKAVPAFESGWDEVGVPLMLMLVVFFPVLIVYLGFIIYGLAKHQTDRTVLALLSPQFILLLALIIMSAASVPEAAPLRMYGQFRGVEFLGLSAVLLGWSATSWRRLFREWKINLLG
jgi:hypothetical protein